MEHIISALGLLMGSAQLIGFFVALIALLRSEPITETERERAEYRSLSWPSA